MKLLKHKTTIFVLLVTAAAILLAACGMSAALSPAGTENVSVLSGTESAIVSTGGGAETEDFSEAFSDRDLSGAYETDEAVTITLNGASAQASSEAVAISGGTVTISAAGTYILTGKLENGSVIVDASKDDKIQLVLDGVTIHSETFAAIYVKQADKVFITLADDSVNTLTNGSGFQTIDDNNVDGVIFSKDDITLNGEGSLTITSPDANGIVGKDEVTITGGTYEITAANHAIEGKDSIAVSDGTFTLTAGEDGLHSENDDDESLGNIYIAGGTFVISVGDDAIHANTLLQIDGGTLTITAAEGLEATYVKINDGDISISATDDGVNAAHKSSAYTPTFEMNGGTLTVVMGPGDTDGIDSNGNIVVNGGTINVTGNSTFDYDGTAQYNGGTIIVNGQQVDDIPNQMMGGGIDGNMGGMSGNMGGGWHH